MLFCASVSVAPKGARNRHITAFLFCKSKTKKPYPNSLGQDFHPAVPPKLTPKHPLDPETIISAATGNGCGPRQKLLAMRRSPCPHKSIHRKVLCRDSTIHDSLKGCLTGYSSCSTVCCSSVVLHYMRPAGICQPLFLTNYHHKAKKNGEGRTAQPSAPKILLFTTAGGNPSPPARRRPPRTSAAGSPWSGASSPRPGCPE